MDRENQFLSILQGGCIKTLFQPIISLTTAEVLGYEALSRAELHACKIDIEQLFGIAVETRRLWAFEKLCRTKALQNAALKPLGAKIFINVDPNIMYDPALKAGFTCEKLREYGLNPNDIIFEITEKSAIADMEAFTASIRHYQKQYFKIAIDDFGSGYSGLGRVCAVSPNYIKIDMELVREIQDDVSKKSVVGGIVQFCKELGIRLIAEGVETEGELRTLIRLGVDYGQGYFLGRPTERFLVTEDKVKQIIKGERKGESAAEHMSPLFDEIQSIGQAKATVHTDDKAIDVYRMMQHDENITEVCVLDRERHVCGVLTREYLFERFGGQFGYNLSAKRSAGGMMTKKFLAVESTASIDDVAVLAMNRSTARVYDSVIVTKEGRYLGVVTVRDLLMTAINMQVKRASEANPLTGLPGNAAVQSVMSSVLKQSEPTSIIYLDIDNFKAYNDAYGFANGDLMIRAVANSMKECCAPEDFTGHIGGDDFVIVSRCDSVKSMCQKMIDRFGEEIVPLYSPDDWKRGHIFSKNRNGITENFPIATLSIAVVISCAENYKSLEDLSRAVARAKGESKQIKGNSVVIA